MNLNQNYLLLTKSLRSNFFSRRFKKIGVVIHESNSR